MQAAKSKLSKICKKTYLSDDQKKSVLAAAPPHLSAPCAVEVIKLDWKYRDLAIKTHQASDDRGLLYSIVQSFGSDAYYFEVMCFDGVIVYDGDDLSEAKPCAV